MGSVSQGNHEHPAGGGDGNLAHGCTLANASLSTERGRSSTRRSLVSAATFSTGSNESGDAADT